MKFNVLTKQKKEIKINSPELETNENPPSPDKGLEKVEDEKLNKEVEHEEEKTGGKIPYMIRPVISIRTSDNQLI